LGSETSLDEAGTAAIKSVELVMKFCVKILPKILPDIIFHTQDECLGGRAIQHREVQHHESSLFISYFKTGMRIEFFS